MEVDQDTHLVILGDMNGQLNSIQEKIQSDINGRMIETWVSNKGLIHLNKDKKCIGKYTFGRLDKPRSAVDHVLVNKQMYEE